MNPAHSIAQLPAPAGSNVVPIYRTRAAKLRAIRTAVRVSAVRDGIGERLAHELVRQAIDDYTAGNSPALAIARARARIRRIVRDRNHA